MYVIRISSNNINMNIVFIYMTRLYNYNYTPSPTQLIKDRKNTTRDDANVVFRYFNELQVQNCEITYVNINLRACPCLI